MLNPARFDVVNILVSNSRLPCVSSGIKVVAPFWILFLWFSDARTFIYEKLQKLNRGHKFFFFFLISCVVHSYFDKLVVLLLYTGLFVIEKPIPIREVY